MQPEVHAFEERERRAEGLPHRRHARGSLIGNHPLHGTQHLRCGPVIYCTTAMEMDIRNGEYNSGRTHENPQRMFMRKPSVHQNLV